MCVILYLCCVKCLKRTCIFKVEQALLPYRILRLCYACFLYLSLAFLVFRHGQRIGYSLSMSMGGYCY